MLFTVSYYKMYFLIYSNIFIIFLEFYKKKKQSDFHKHNLRDSTTLHRELVHRRRFSCVNVSRFIVGLFIIVSSSYAVISLDTTFFRDNEDFLNPLINYFEDSWISHPNRRGSGQSTPLFPINMWN